MDQLPRNIDDLLSYLQDVKVDITKNLSPEKIKGYFKSDPECRRQMGNLDGDSDFTCVNCETVGRLVNLTLGVPKKIYIESGTYEGLILDVDESPLIYECDWNQKLLELHNKLEKIEGIAECGYIKKAKKYICTTLWVNSVLINWQLERIVKNHINPIMYSFICSDKGYRMQFDHIKPLSEFSDLNEEKTYYLLLQLAAIFISLKPHCFVHGSCTFDKLSFTDYPCGYKLEDRVIEGPFTLYLGGFHMSSINVKETRLVPSVKGRDVDLEYNVNNFLPVITKFHLGEYDLETKKTEKGPLIYTIKGMNSVALATIRYSGYPVFGGSFDIYTCLVSLLSWQPFRCQVKKSEKLTAIIRGMFPYNLPVIHRENIKCSIQASTCLADNWMYCDASDKLMSLLETYKL